VTDLRDVLCETLRTATQTCPDDWDASYWKADAVIAALPGAIIPLVWSDKYPTEGGGRYTTTPPAYRVYGVREYGFKWEALGIGVNGLEKTAEAAMDAANNHRRAATLAAFGLNEKGEAL